MKKKSILIPLDNSNETFNSLNALKSFFNNEDVVVYLLNVINNYEVNAPEYLTSNAAKEVSESILSTGRSLIPEYEVHTISFENQGEPIAKDILSIIAGKQIDTVIMTKTGKGFYHKYVIGSVTSRVVKISPVPVIVIP